MPKARSPPVSGKPAPAAAEQAPKNTLIFGGPLEASMIFGKVVRVPPVFEAITRCLERKHILEKGIYRVTGSMQMVEELVQLWTDHAQCDLDVLPIDFVAYDPHVLSSVIKLFLRKLSEPLFTFGGYQRFLNSVRTGTELARVNALVELITRLPLCNILLLEHLFAHLAALSACHEENKMTPENLGIVFSPSLLWQVETGDAASALSASTDLSAGIALLIANWDAIRAKVHVAALSARADFEAKFLGVPDAPKLSREEQDDERALAHDPAKTILARAKFDKRSSFGRFQTVYLELRGFEFAEFSAMSKKPLRVCMLDSGSCKVANASELINEPNTFMLVTSREGKKDKKDKNSSRKFFRAADGDIFHTWLTCLRRAIGTSDIAAGRGAKAKGLVDVTLFSDPCCVTDIAGTIVDVNQSCCSLLGWNQPSDMIGKSNKIMIPPAIAKHHDNYTKRHDLSGSKRLIGKPRQMRAMRRDGSLVPVILSLGEVGDGEGKRFVATMRHSSSSGTILAKSTSFNSASDEQEADDESRHIPTEMIEALDKFVDNLNSAVDDVQQAATYHENALRAKITRVKAKNETLTETIDELDRSVRLLNLNSLMARRALDVLIANDCDEVLRVNVQFASEQEEAEADLAYVRSCITAELGAGKAVPTLFAADGLNARKISAFLFVVGGKWLGTTLSSVLRGVRNNTATLDITQFDHESRSTGDPPLDPKVARSVSRAIAAEAERVLSAMAAGADNCPEPIRSVFHFLKAQMRKHRSVERYNVKPRDVVVSFLFARFFFPAATDPHAFGLLAGSSDATTTGRDAEVFRAVGNVLQCLATRECSAPEGSAAAEAIGKFMQKNHSTLTNIAAQVLAAPDQDSREGD